MRILKFSLVCIMLIMFFLAQFVNAEVCYHNGNQILEGMREHDKLMAGDQTINYQKATYFMGYVSGVNDATSYLYGYISEVTVNQICSIVTIYLKKHPEKLNQCASILVIEALKEAFPKKP
jgi:hypothetical protein